MKRTQLLIALVGAMLGCGLFGGTVKGDDKAELIAACEEATKLQKEAKYAAAATIYQKALRLAVIIYGENHEKTADILNDLASLYLAQTKYAEAEPLYTRSLKIKEAAFGKDNPKIADTLDNLATLYKKQAKYAEAELLYKRSLKIKEATLGNDHSDVATSLNGLALLYSDQAKYAEAEPLYNRSLKIKEATLGNDHPEVASVLNNLAGLYRMQSKYAEAEPLYRRSLAMTVAALGKGHPGVAATLNNLALLYKAQVKYVEAEVVGSLSLEIFEAAYGEAHADVIDSMETLKYIHLYQGSSAKAVSLQTRSRQGTRSFMLRELPSLSSREQQDYLSRTETARFGVAIWLGSKLSQNQTVAAQSAEWLLNGKAIGSEAQTLNALLEREADPALLRQLNDLRAQEAALALKLAKPEQRDAVQAQRREVEKAIAQAGGAAAKLAQPWIDLGAVRKAIPEGGLLIDIARYKSRRIAARYVAWVIPPAGDVAVVDLGEADAIDAAVKEARGVVAKAAKRIKEVGEPKAAAEMAEPLQKLADLVLKPLTPHLGKAKSLILSPDGELWLAPWAALPVGKGRFLIEDVSLRYVITGRDLVVTPPAKKLATSAPLILADPKFDDGAGEVAPAPDAGRGTLGRLPLVERLPGTATEAEAVLPRLETLTGAAPTVHTDEKATEAAVKSAVRPKVLILATHGFFLPTQEVALQDDRLAGEGKRATPSLTKDGSPVENPLLRCGLLLAGCNRRGALKAGEDDGVLTGLEIVGTDLRGTEMVVLSACETGLGDVKTGEGVAGLRQAFQLAGAESVVATLWQIPDAQSAQLMVGFFDHLTKKLPRDEALRASQLEQIKARRDRFGAAHPFFWAAYTVTGQVK